MEAHGVEVEEAAADDDGGAADNADVLDGVRGRKDSDAYETLEHVEVGLCHAGAARLPRPLAPARSPILYYDLNLPVLLEIVLHPTLGLVVGFRGLHISPYFNILTCSLGVLVQRGGTDAVGVADSTLLRTCQFEGDILAVGDYVVPRRIGSTILPNTIPRITLILFLLHRYVYDVVVEARNMHNGSTRLQQIRYPLRQRSVRILHEA